MMAGLQNYKKFKDYSAYQPKKMWSFILIYIIRAEALIKIIIKEFKIYT